MRVLIYSMNFSPELTGVGKYSGEMADWLAGQGHEVRVVTTPAFSPEWKIHDGFSGKRYSRDRSGATAMPRVTRCPVWVPRQPRGFKRLLHLMSFCVSSFPVILSESRWKADLVWVVEPTFFSVPAALLAARISGAKAWLHIQDFEVDMAFELGLLPGSLKKLAFWLESFLMSKFDRVSTISGTMLEKLFDKSVPRSRAVMFPNWVNTDTIFPQSEPNSFRAELNIPPDATAVLYSGNLSMKQGLDVLLDAIHLLAAHPDIYPVICGDGPARSALRQLDGYSNVRLLPLQPFARLNDLLNLADIHVLPQRADAADLVMPSKLTGMLASGRPVVATAHEGTQLARIVEKCGRVVVPGNATLLAESLLDLARDPLLRRSLGKAARNIAVEKLDSQYVLSNFQSEIISLCGHSRKMAESAVPAQ